MSTYFLQKQRKGELMELAKDVGMKDYENLLKTDLEVALEEHLRANQTSLSKNPSLEPFYRKILSGSPTKSSALVPFGGDEKKSRARRQTRGRVEESDAPSDSSAPPTTPRTSLSFARSLPLPPSPAVLANQIDAQTSSLRASLANQFASSPIPGTLSSLRSTLSSVTTIHVLVLLLEAFGLRTQVLPLRYLTTIPPIPALGISDSVAIKIPDLFALLTGEFWGPTLLWLATSLVLPVVGAWFVNFRRGEQRVDAVVFSVLKGLGAWVFYSREGWAGESRVVVERGVPGGAVGMLVGAGVGGVVSLWEGVGGR